MNKLILLVLILISFSSCNKDINEMEIYEGTWIQTEATVNDRNAFLPARVVTIEIFDADKEFSNFNQTVKYRNNNEIISEFSGKLILGNKGEYVNWIRDSLVIRKEIIEINNNILKYTYKIREYTYVITYEKQ